MILLEKRMRGLTGDLSATVSILARGEVTPESVHRLRTTARRIESLVSYANPDLDKKLERCQEKLADLRRRAGKVRDFDVQLGLLGVLANGSTARDRETLAALLGKKRGRQARRLTSAVIRLQGSKFFVRMDRLAERAGMEPEQRPLPPLQEARTQLAKMTNEFSSNQGLGLKRLHDARTRLKQIRYVAELAEESPERKAFIRELKTVQDAVGDWHDWQELTSTAEKRFSDRMNCALLREVRALLAARHSTAVSAVDKIFTSALAPARKPPQPVQSARALTRYA
jgi:CHAD domain-containing protein